MQTKLPTCVPLQIAIAFPNPVQQILQQLSLYKDLKKKKSMKLSLKHPIVLFFPMKLFKFHQFSTSPSHISSEPVQNCNSFFCKSSCLMDHCFNTRNFPFKCRHISFFPNDPYIVVN